MCVGSKRVMFLSIFVNSGFTIIYFTVTNTVVVTDMVTPNALLTVSVCLCRIARKIRIANCNFCVLFGDLICVLAFHVFVFIIIDLWFLLID